MIPLNDSKLDRYASVAAGQIDQLCVKWQIQKEVAQDLVKLALFDIILYIGEDFASSSPNTTNEIR